MDLPEHIILYNILSQTPSKSLARFKCVSKHWNRVISDPEFMKSRSRRMILLPVLPFQAIDYNSIKHEVDNMGVDYYSTVKLVDAPFECNKLSIVGTFSGIVLLVLNRDRYCSVKEQMILYNPLTGAFMKLPDSPLRSRGIIEYSLFGFGYGTTPDDLKIVALRFEYIMNSTHSMSLEVFGLKNGLWSTTRVNKLIRDSTFESYAGTFVNRSLYWLSYNRRTKEYSIVALDLNQMVFLEIKEVPSCDFATLGTLNGSLCVVCCKQTYTDVVYELRVMNKDEDGFEKTRTTFRYFIFDPAYLAYEKLNLGFKMSILDEGKILRLDRRRNKLIIIGMLKKSYKEVKTITSNLLRKASISKAIEYVESWVSPSQLCSSLI